jgi:hypothetical protein
MATESIIYGPESGIFVAGWTVSSSAQFGIRQDGGGEYIRIEEEIAAMPWLVRMVRFLDPTDERIKLKGDQVLEFPGLVVPNYVRLRVLQFNLKSDSLEVSKAQIEHEGKWISL